MAVIKVYLESYQVIWSTLRSLTSSVHRLTHDDVFKWKHFPRYWPLWGEFIGHRWIPLTKASDAEIWTFFLSAPEQTPVVWVPSRSLWGHWKFQMTKPDPNLISFGNRGGHVTALSNIILIISYTYFLQDDNMMIEMCYRCAVCPSNKNLDKIMYSDVSWAWQRLRSPATWLFIQQSVQANENSKLHITDIWEGIHWWLVDSPYKW